ncbi:polysaccharide biosynthesis protein [Rubrobacter xylanophilus DSM 9941]|uniref:Polysaccharide biosynthesis protein n=1 Tax=Rubrobacter xylanophilus (strain DSM 9941 / JCM 11954 / NBRC 16129 / PRD-1) TaxID=266117 RepID=Q1AUN9_RUBXD|nr:oligosaccharide flippase family protein [Rubrobacter xylanophilus]ABG04889.1 polysaccharide biosynthesis protein [Rubrobacter xylanophilus DSM 9941]
MEAAGGGRQALPGLAGRLLSGGAWVLAGKVFIAGSGLLSGALLARLLTPRELGAYFLVYSVVLFGSMLGSLGLQGAATRLVAHNLGLGLPGRARFVVRISLALGALGALGAGAAYLALCGPLAGLFGAPALAASGGLVAGWIAVSVVQGLVGEVFRGLGDVRLATLLGGQVTGTVTGVLTVGLLVLGLGLLWLLRGEADLATVLALAVCAGASTTLLSGWLLGRRMSRLSGRRSGGGELPPVFGEVVATAWPLLVTNLVLFALRNGDIWLLGAFGSREEVAVYGAATRLISMVTMPLIVANAVLPPVIAGMYAREEGREELERTVRATSAVTGLPALAASAACVLFAAPLLGLVYGDYYRAGAGALAVLSLGQLVSVWTGSCGLALQMTGHQRTMMAVSVGTGAATLAAMFALVVPYGVAGVVAARVSGLVLQNLLLWLAARYRTGMWTHAGFGALLRSARRWG